MSQQNSPERARLGRGSKLSAGVLSDSIGHAYKIAVSLDSALVKMFKNL